MGKAETELSVAVKRNASKDGHRLFRNNRGAYQDERGQWISYGVGPGGSDDIGWASVTVTPEMVGKTVAIFLSVEAKTGKKAPGIHQDRWINMVNEQGGIAVWGNNDLIIQALIRYRIRALQEGSSDKRDR